jgi:hypothetical protein
MVERILEDEKTASESENEQQRRCGEACVEMNPPGDAPKL